MILGLALAGAYSDLPPRLGFTDAQASVMANVVIERGAFPTCPHCHGPVEGVEVYFAREDVFGLFPKDKIRIDNGHRKVTVHCHGVRVTASAWIKPKAQKRKKSPAKS